MTRSCPACGAGVPETAKFCNECGAPLAPGSPGPAPAASPEKIEKSTALALIGSAVVPGLGQVYEGNIVRGYLVFLGTLFGFFLFIIPGIIVWLYGMYDAYTTATQMNDGSIPGQPAPVLHMLVFIIVAFLVAILSLVLVALMVTSLFSQPTVTFAMNTTGISSTLDTIYGI